MSLLQGMNIVLCLHVKNPNSKSVMMDAVFCQLSKKSDGTVLSEETVIKRELFRPEAAKTVNVPMKIGLLGMSTSAKSMLVKGTTKIDIVGTVTFEAAPATGDKEININFKGSWEVDMTG
jgi:LEA14-like dessication related protein